MQSVLPTSKNAAHIGSIQPLNAMLLAAGRGERMRPLTDFTPKPLLAVHGHPLLDWHISALLRDGVGSIMVNTAWLGGQIPEHLNTRWPELASASRRLYSKEVDDFGRALDTAGGIARALPLLGTAFWLAAGDVFVPDFVFDAQSALRFTQSNDLAHLWLVPNPAHNPKGDFGWVEEPSGSSTGRVVNQTHEAGRDIPRYTYSTIALLKAELFAAPWCDIPPGNPQGAAEPLAPILRRAVDAGRVGATLYKGRWTDVGTPERLAQLNADRSTTAMVEDRSL